MNLRKKTNKCVSGLIIFLALTINLLQAQDYKLSLNESSLKIYGTSSLHDWEEVAESYSGVMSFNDFEKGEINKLSVEILAESLKSGKNAMDKNTYKALNTNKFKKIMFSVTKIKSVTPTGTNTYKVETNGKMTISGQTNDITLSFVMQVNQSAVKIEGSKTIKMTDFGIEPPKALFGTITTGDEITIKFSTKFIQPN